MKTSSEVDISASMGPKTPERLKEDIVGIKTIIEGLAEEVAKLETKKKQYVAEIKNNENLLNAILEEVSKDNKAFLQKLQHTVDKKANLTVTMSEPFIKRNYRKIKEVFEEKSINFESDAKRSGDPRKHQSPGRCDSRGSFEEVATLDKGRALAAENSFMLAKAATVEDKCLPSVLRALATPRPQ